MKLSDGKIATPCITEESMKCVRESLKIQGKEILHADTTESYPDVHGKIFTEFVVVFKNNNHEN